MTTTTVALTTTAAVFAVAFGGVIALIAPARFRPRLDKDQLPQTGPESA